MLARWAELTEATGFSRFWVCPLPGMNGLHLVIGLLALGL